AATETRPQRALVFQPVSEPRRLNLLPKIAAGVAVEIDHAEPAPLPMSPPAVIPRPCHKVVQVLPVVLLEQLVNLVGTVKVLLVPPAGHVEVWDLQFQGLQVGRKSLRLPKLVVIGMRDELVPGGYRAVEVFRAGIRERSQTQVPVESVGLVELEVEVRLRRLHQRGVLETVAEAESAVMVKVIAQELVFRRRLFGGGSKRRMRVQERHRGEPAAVRDAQNSHAAIMIRNIFQQPVDAVVNVCALIDGVGITPAARIPEHHEVAFGPVASANVLENEDVSLRNELLINAEFRGETLFVVVQPVGSAFENEGQGLSGIFRRVDFSV